MKMKKVLLLFTLLVGIAIGSCTKPAEEQNMFGMWYGKYALDSTTIPSFDVIYQIDEGHILYVYNGKDTSIATRKGRSSQIYFIPKENEVLMKVYYHYNDSPLQDYIINVVFDANFRTLSGTWSYQSALAEEKVGAIIANKKL
jgi:hypothetical protein